jgi:TFIIF-interacting CTD phosphatase-like protein
MDKEYKMNVILDLDNTIINALEENDRKKLPIDFSNKFQYKDYIPYFRIYARPHLEEFLNYLFKHYNVAVLTAAEKDYATFIVNNFILTKPGRKLEFVFYRNHVDTSEKVFGGMKDLRMLWDLYKVRGFYPSNTVIIDDLDLVYQTNMFNTIRLYPFFVVDEETYEPNYEASNDTELLNVIQKLEFLRNKFQTTPLKWEFLGILDFKVIQDKEEETQ